MKSRLIHLFSTLPRKTVIGLSLCLLLFVSGFIIHGNTGLYLNLSGFIIVMGGTFGAALLSYRMERLIILIKVLFSAYRRDLIPSESLVDILVELAVKRRLKGLLSLERDEQETTIKFLRQAIGLMVDGYSQDQIRDSLNAEMYFFKFRRNKSVQVLRTLADVAPSFGLIGSVVGLINMLAGVESTTHITAAIPIALTSTLYGIVLSNFFFLPFAERIRDRTMQELLRQKIIAEGIVAIKGNLHPRMLDRKLKSFLTPSQRQEELISLAHVREKIRVMDEELTQE